MEHSLPFGRGGNVRYQEVGSKIELLMEAPNDGCGLYQGWIRGVGNRLELGSLMPEQQVLRLRRSLPLERLRAVGCWPIKEAGVTLIHSFGSSGTPQGWKRESHPERFFSKDPSLRELVSKLEYCLLHTGKDGFSLAVPYDRRNPFVLMPLFCFATIRSLDGRLFAVFSFYADGRPRMMV